MRLRLLPVQLCTSSKKGTAEAVDLFLQQAAQRGLHMECGGFSHRGTGKASGAAHLSSRGLTGVILAGIKPSYSDSVFVEGNTPHPSRKATRLYMESTLTSRTMSTWSRAVVCIPPQHEPGSASNCISKASSSSKLPEPPQGSGSHDVSTSSAAKPSPCSATRYAADAYCAFEGAFEDTWAEAIQVDLDVFNTSPSSSHKREHMERQEAEAQGEACRQILRTGKPHAQSWAATAALLEPARPSCERYVEQV